MWVFLVMACGGGDDPSGDDSGSQSLQTGTPYCEDTSTPLGWDEAAPDGTVPSEAIAEVEGSYSGVFTHDNGTTANLTLTVSRSGEPTWIDSEAYYYPDGGPDLGVICDDGVAMPVSIVFSLSDGVFNENWNQDYFLSISGYYYYYSGSGLGLRTSIDPALLGGSYTVTEVNPADYDYVEVSFSGSAADGLSTGSVALQGQQTSGSAVSFGHLADLGEWSASRAP